MLEASFQRFCAMVKKKLTEEFEAAYRLPILNLLHDSCTTGNNKKGIVGTSVSFINRNWDYCNLALLVTVHNGSHASSEVKTLMTSRIEALYRISIADMAQFTMSDTTPSARKVSKLFEDSISTDCTMHVLNFAISAVWHKWFKGHLQRLFGRSLFSDEVPPRVGPRMRDWVLLER
ncbi:hypothetical protein DVH05_023782 [Phytophthora capsici]|nr:hypothetical protein DVH05_023782 [Phytophthora capsici]